MSGAGRNLSGVPHGVVSEGFFGQLPVTSVLTTLIRLQRATGNVCFPAVGRCRHLVDSDQVTTTLAQRGTQGIAVPERFGCIGFT